MRGATGFLFSCGISTGIIYQHCLKLVVKWNRRIYNTKYSLQCPDQTPKSRSHSLYKNITGLVRVIVCFRSKFVEISEVIYF